jgi:hypothetical protein
MSGAAAPTKTGTSTPAISAVSNAVPNVGRGKGHQDRDGVVGGGVGVDEEIAHGSDVC